MTYTLRYDDYHGHTVRENFIANTDKEAIDIAKKSCYNFASYSPVLLRKNNDGTLTQLDF